MSDRKAVFVAGAVVQALGHDVSKVSFSRSSIRRYRESQQKQFFQDDVASFSVDRPVLLHWDCKLLPKDGKGGEKADRLAVHISFNGTEKLLAIPEIARSTGELQAQACLQTLETWRINQQVKGLVFDTTSSNTVAHNGACTRTEKNLGHEVAWIACRHHVMEILLSRAFKSVFGPSQGPEFSLFKKFKIEWGVLSLQTFTPASNELFQCPQLQSLKGEMLAYLPRVIENKQPRDDYREFLELSLAFIGEKSADEYCPRAPGPLHNARWMAKGIYCLKIYLYRLHFKLDAMEEQKVAIFSLFVSLVYAKYWHEAPNGVRAPFNDLELLSLLDNYPHREIAEAAIKGFKNHLWWASFFRRQDTR